MKKVHFERDRYARERSDQRLNKAAEVFAKRGFAQVGMRELAKHLGLSSGSLYHHIEGKQALLQELIEDLYLALLTTSGQQSAQSHPSKCLEQFVKRHLALHQQMAHHFLLAERDVHQLEENRWLSVAKLRGEYEATLAGVLASIAPSTDDATCRVLSKSLVSTLNYLPSWLSSDLDQSRRFELALEMILGMVQPYLDQAENAKTRHVTDRAHGGCFPA